MEISIRLKKILQVAYECHLNAEYAIKGYIENENLAVSIQFMSQAFLCAKQVQNLFYEVTHERAYEIEQFYHQFLILNHEFLESLETDHGMQATSNELDTLSNIYDDMKQTFSELTI